MPKLIFKNKELDVPFNTAEKILKAYQTNTLTNEQREYIKGIQKIIFADGVYCLHDWQDYKKLDGVVSGRQRFFSGRQCSKCQKTEIMDLSG